VYYFDFLHNRPTLTMYSGYLEFWYLIDIIDIDVAQVGHYI